MTRSAPSGHGAEQDAGAFRPAPPARARRSRRRRQRARRYWSTSTPAQPPPRISAAGQLGGSPLRLSGCGLASRSARPSRPSAMIATVHAVGRNAGESPSTGPCVVCLGMSQVAASPAPRRRPLPRSRSSAAPSSPPAEGCSLGLAPLDHLLEAHAVGPHGLRQLIPDQHRVAEAALLHQLDDLLVLGDGRELLRQFRADVVGQGPSAPRTRSG